MRIGGHRCADDLANSDYISLRNPVYVTHSAGRYAVKRFRKANCPIIERLTNSLMMHGRNNGKKLMAVRIVDHAFEIVRNHRHTARKHAHWEREQFWLTWRNLCRFTS